MSKHRGAIQVLHVPTWCHFSCLTDKYPVSMHETGTQDTGPGKNAHPFTSVRWDTLKHLTLQRISILISAVMLRTPFTLIYRALVHVWLHRAGFSQLKTGFMVSLWVVRGVSPDLELPLQNRAGLAQCWAVPICSVQRSQAHHQLPDNNRLYL